ncbi:MAG: acylphosphatase [Gemmatimonadota bacterium]
MPDSSAGEAVRFVVSGRVQGVGFRWWCMRAGSALDVWGTIRNLADGSVEVIAAGQAEALATLEQRLWKGPALARVTAVRSSPAESTGSPDAGLRVVG